MTNYVVFCSIFLFENFCIKVIVEFIPSFFIEFLKIF